MSMRGWGSLFMPTGVSNGGDFLRISIIYYSECPLSLFNLVAVLLVADFVDVRNPVQHESRDATRSDLWSRPNNIMKSL